METKFSRNIKTKLTADQLWSLMVSGVQNSANHPFWPTHLEESHAESLKTGGEINVSYKFFLKGKPVTYKITDFDESARHLAYKTTENHPLDGHAEFKIYPNNAGGSTLRWEGIFKYPWYSRSGLFMRTVFLNMFFSELNDAIHKYEKKTKKTAKSKKVSTQTAPAL